MTRLFFLLLSWTLLAGQNRSPSDPFISGDGFRAHADYIYDETDRSLDPRNVKPRSVIFVKTDYLLDFFTQLHPFLPPYILVTHNSDYGIPGPFALFLKEEKLIAWFGQNVEEVHPKLYPIPIGIANQYWGHGNPTILQRIRAKNGSKVHLAYLNIAVQTYPAEREAVFRHFATAPYCHRATKRSFSDYLEDLKQSQFVFSPRGNGLDTHRLWEALYMGAYPIVKSSALDPVYENLPVVVVEDWSQVNEDFLRCKYEEMSQKTYALDRLNLQYWIEKIRSLL